jgi:hypothetical protein
MGNALQMASIRTELRPTVPLLTDQGALTPDTPPPIGMFTGRRILARAHAYMPARDIDSGSSSGPLVFEAAESVGVPGPYARFCIYGLLRIYLHALG